LVRKRTTSEIIPHLAYMKIMHAEYLVCKNMPIYADKLGLRAVYRRNTPTDRGVYYTYMYMYMYVHVLCMYSPHMHFKSLELKYVALPSTKG